MDDPATVSETAQQAALAGRLAKARAEAGLSIERASESSGIPIAVIEKYEGERMRAPNAFVVAALARTYAVATDYLLGLTEDDDLPSGTFVVFQEVVDRVRNAGDAGDIIDLIEWTPTFLPFWDVVGPRRRVSSKSEVYALSLELETRIGALAPDLVNTYMQGLLTMMDLRDEEQKRLGRS